MSSEEGFKPDPAKIQGVQEMPTPESKQDVKRPLGMVNYLQKFAPNLSEATAPMRAPQRRKPAPVGRGSSRSKF